MALILIVLIPTPALEKEGGEGFLRVSKKLSRE